VTVCPYRRGLSWRGFGGELVSTGTVPTREKRAEVLGTSLNTGNAIIADNLAIAA
jgi:hypothetical protein